MPEGRQCLHQPSNVDEECGGGGVPAKHDFGHLNRQAEKGSNQRGSVLRHHERVSERHAARRGG
eukprot:3840222-Rhodomonas_salina.1